MKKFLLTVFAIAVLIPTHSWAKKAMQLSVKAGVNLANMSSDEENDPDRNMKIGAAVGAGLTVPLSDMFGIRAELLFSQKGFKYSQTIPFFGNIDASVAINYLDIPITAVLMLPGESVQPLFFAGPMIGIKMGDPTATVNGVSGDADGKFKSTDIGLALGAGLNFPLGKNAIGADIRYTLGLTNINEEASPVVKNNVISILLNYTFSLSK